MNNVITRSITGLVYIGLIIAAIFAGGYWMLWLVMLLAFLAINEFTGITNKQRIPAVLRALDLMTAGMAFLMPYALFEGSYRTGLIFLVIAFFMISVRMIAALYVKVDNPLKETAFSLMAQLYITLPLLLLLMIYYQSAPLVLLMFVMIWLNDTGAFCVGSLIGKNKLFERISPKKSWEGFVGGVVFSVLAGVVAHCIWGGTALSRFSMVDLAVLGLLVAVFATFGDLVESLIKRTLGIKDSGSILPGHGGILDRIDSLLFVAPVTFIFISAKDLF
ncbi:MAG: phosphatidate cytidylyltransferase [Muribaculaceae bacterium]|nr:phosphatidate cytidylyltransferase [Muribaculaceae bacterium]